MTTQLLLSSKRAVRLFFQQKSVVFRPGPVLARTPADLGLEYERVQLRCRNGVKAPAWWVPHRNSDRTVLYFHGSDGNITHELPVIGFLHALGVNVFLAEYPGYGTSTGRTSEGNCYRVADSAWHHLLRHRSLAPEHIYLFGQSIGSAVATYLAALHTCGGLVFQSGFSSVPDLAARLYPGLPARYFSFIRMNSLRRIPSCSAPLLCLHSYGDEHVPVELAERVYAAAPSPKRFVYLPGSHWSAAWQGSGAVQGAWGELLSGRTQRWG